jgi:hypothetical protein
LRDTLAKVFGVTDPTQSDDDLDDDLEIDDREFDVPALPASDPVATARRRHGAAGAMLAAGLFGVDIALGRKPKEEVPVVVAANDEPGDIDTEGIVVAVNEHTSIVAPAQPRPDPFARAPRKRRTRARR